MKVNPSERGEEGGVREQSRDDEEVQQAKQEEESRE